MGERYPPKRKDKPNVYAFSVCLFHDNIERQKESVYESTGNLYGTPKLFYKRASVKEIRL